MKYKIVYNMANGLEEKAYENPRKGGEYIFPGGCIEEASPEFDKESQICKYVDGSWVVTDKPKPVEIDMSTPPIPDPVHEEPSEPELEIVPDEPIE